jgi:16S rRNA G966 N2-methylase RsmD
LRGTESRSAHFPYGTFLIAAGRVRFPEALIRHLCFRRGAQTLGKVAAELAYGEGLQAHARSAQMRLKVAGKHDASWRNRIYCEDALTGLQNIPDASIDLILADPPYGLGKDYGNDSDKLEADAYLDWMTAWIDLASQNSSEMAVCIFF